ncbi:MAG: phage head closure protein [Alphaproteobacteria bacterium]|nr:phage head closure protein [Alphaproteobacteria bacterium]
MRIAELRHKIQIQSPTRTEDGGGGGEVAWHTVAEVWAKIAPTSGREEINAEKRRGTISHKVTLRWRPGMGPTQRIVHGTRGLQIESATDPGERRRWLICGCVERAEP